MKLRNMFAGILAGAMVLSLTACGSDPKPGNTSGSGGEEQSLTLSIGYTTASNDDDPYHLTALRFKELVEEKTNGRITVIEYPSSQLGSEPEMWEGMQTGTCDMAVMTNAYVSSYVPANGTLDLPFIFSDLEQARSVLDRRDLPGVLRGRIPAALYPQCRHTHPRRPGRLENPLHGDQDLSVRLCLSGCERHPHGLGRIAHCIAAGHRGRL